jgi:hypothetical protein
MVGARCMARWRVFAAAADCRAGACGYGCAGRAPFPRTRHPAHPSPATPRPPHFTTRDLEGWAGNARAGRRRAASFLPTVRPRAPQRPARRRPARQVYRLPTVPLLLIEMILVMKVPGAETVLLSRELGTASTIIVVSGHPGEVQTKHHGLWVKPKLVQLDPADRRAVAFPERRLVAYRGPAWRRPAIRRRVVDHVPRLRRSAGGCTCCGGWVRHGTPATPGPSTMP